MAHRRCVGTSPLIPGHMLEVGGFRGYMVYLKIHNATLVGFFMQWFMYTCLPRTVWRGRSTVSTIGCSSPHAMTTTCPCC